MQFYIPWNYHQLRNDSDVDFQSDNRDVNYFLELIHREHMIAMVRLGPYVCGEWENGGLPYWLLQYDNIKMRTRDPRSARQISNMTASRVNRSRFLAETSRWFGTLLPRVIIPNLLATGRGPVAMLQVLRAVAAGNAINAPIILRLCAVEKSQQTKGACI